MKTLIILEAQVKPGHLDKAEKLFNDTLPDTRNFEGCQGIDIYVERQGGAAVTDFIKKGVGGTAGAPKDEGEKIVMVEYWDSLEAYHKYVSWRQEMGALPDFEEMCEGPPTFRSFDQMDV